ncbi:MAG TPA: nickel-responsive transcriptional regulator NikR [Gammaproteobacteria bacterium]|nr:nickel-responsive transcriptional regulator NikR [Gammaproteobacteria bacterium]
MSELVRFGVSIDAELLTHFDQLIQDKGYANRSEAIRDLIRDRLVKEEWDSDQDTVGTITIVYDHHTRELMSQLTHLQHSFEGEIKSVLHVHLDHHNCLEVMVVSGKGHLLQAFADKLVATRGVKHGSLAMATTGQAIPSTVPSHGHSHG